MILDIISLALSSAFAVTGFLYWKRGAEIRNKG